MHTESKRENRGSIFIISSSVRVLGAGAGEKGIHLLICNAALPSSSCT